MASRFSRMVNGGKLNFRKTPWFSSKQHQQIHFPVMICFFTKRKICGLVGNKHAFYNLSSIHSHCLTNKLKRSLIHNNGLFSQHSWKSYSKLYDTFEDQPPSWLFVSDAVAGRYGAQVNLELDLERLLLSEQSISKLQKNIDDRHMKFDLNLLVSNFQTMISLNEQRQQLLEQRENLVALLKNFKTGPQIGGDYRFETKDEVKKEMERCKTNLKSLLKELWSVEDKVIRSALQLPNTLHRNTPMKESRLKDKQFYDKDPLHSLSHVEIGKKFDIIKFSNVGPQAYYLKGPLSAVSLQLTDLACDYFSNQNYRLMSGPEFYKTPILEGCGQDVYNKDKVLTLQQISREIEPMTHLAGVSPMTFAAYLAKLCVGDASLPFKMFAVGPHYRQVSKPLGLYNAAQTTQVATFCATSLEDVDKQYEEMVTTVWEFVKKFGFSVRLSECPAPVLRREERRRTQIDIWAPSLHQYVPISHVSDLGDFVSRRLMCVHNQNHANIRDTKLLHMISGVTIDLTTLLCVWMEHSSVTQDSFTLMELPFLKKTSQ